MLRGTRILMGDEAAAYVSTIDILRGILLEHEHYQEVILPAIWEQQTFVDKAGPEIVNQMWSFNDKGDRPVCLIPEATGLIQEMWRDDWQKNQAKPCRIFYVSRCYRYERPQAGRYPNLPSLASKFLAARRRTTARRRSPSCATVSTTSSPGSASNIPFTTS